MPESLLLVSAVIAIGAVAITLMYAQERVERALGKGRRRDRTG